MGTDRIRSDTPIRRERVTFDDPVFGIEAPPAAWVSAAVVGVPTTIGLFWLLYGLFTTAGGGSALVLLAVVLALAVGAVTAVLAGVVANKVITPTTPLGHHMGVFWSEMTAPHRPDEHDEPPAVLPPAPPQLAAPRTGTAPLPPHFYLESNCVHPECLREGAGRDHGGT